MNRSLPKILTSLFVVILFSACATYKPQSSLNTDIVSEVEKPIYTFYIASGLGNAGSDGNPETEALLKSYLDKADKESMLLYTGDYTIKNGNKSDNKKLLDRQITLASDFKGKTRFIPGQNEWSSKNTKDIEWVEDYLKDNDIKDSKVEPNNVCPIEYKELTDDLDILYVDSNWFISDWEGIEYINKKCTDINTKRRFLTELEGYIKDSRGKNLLLVMHHPIFSNGKNAGKETFLESITPLPLVGNIINEFENLAGFTPQKMNSIRYTYFQMMISALAQDNDNITIVSGHEESLQYLRSKDIRQIVSGSMGTHTGTKLSPGTIANLGGTLKFDGKFSYGKEGFAILRYFKDGSSKVEFITSEDTHTFAVNNEFPKEMPEFETPKFNEKTKTVPVTSDEEKLNKSGFYKFIWGERYREYFGVPVIADVAILDTLYSGLKVTQQGGGHQSFSARLADKEGREYALRGLEKNALKFLRFKVKGIAYNEEAYRGTFAEKAVYDFFSTTHPYMQLVINPLAKASGINHANTQLYYIPKQPGFRLLGPQYGDQLYFIEERPNDEQKVYEGYNRANPKEKGDIVNFESTTDVLEKLNEDEKYTIDQKAYIRARLFDMLIGDWDRHEDQWRWAEYEINQDDVRFIPIPRDRDAAFSKFDGIAIPIIKMVLPDVRFWQSYAPDIKNVKWFNGEGNNLDRAILNKYDASVWVEEAKIIQNKLSDAEIDAAFMLLPKEVQDEASADIRENLKGRLKNLDEIAKIYGDRMNETVVIHATHKDDKIEITRMPEGKTNITMKRLLSDEKNPVFFDRTFNRDETKEIWIYGLNDDDKFEVKGEGDHEIMLRLIGGYGKDEFTVTNKKALKVYDLPYEKTEFPEKTPRHQFTKIYETNTFFWRNFNENNNVFLPNAGYRVDDGFFIGATDTYTNKGFNGEDFRYKHSLGLNYYFNYQAIEAKYDGVFANIFPQWNLEAGGYFTSDTFANNFFGLGNNTNYDEEVVEREFNRARMKQIKLYGGIAYRSIRFRGLFENYQVDFDDERFFTPTNVNENVFNNQNYVGAEASLDYKNVDALDFPTRGLYIDATLGYKANTEIDSVKFGYAAFKFGFDRKLIESGNLVLGSKAEIKTNFGDEYYFYHAPSIGGNNGLRGYRNERFTGETTFYHSTDLKLRLKRYITAVAPITVGVYGGFDYGRVWVDNDDSNTIHTSYGGGFWVGSLNAFAINAGYFVSPEDAIIQVGLGFKF